MNKAVIFTLVMVFGIICCKNKNEDTIYPKPFCDTTNVTYSAVISPIMQKNCVSCHCGGFTDGAPVELDSFKYCQVVCLNGMLYKAIIGVTRQMPPGGTLTDCEIAKIKNWLDKGSINN